MVFQRRTYKRYKFKAKRKYGPKKGVLTRMIRDIKTLKRNAKISYTTHNLYGNYSSGALGIVAPYYASNLCNFATLATCFGTNETDINGNTFWMWDKFELDFTISYGNEPDNLYINLYVVSLKKDTNLYDRPTGNLATLTSPNNYIYNSLGATNQSYINPQDFTIHWRKRLILGNNGQTIPTATGTGAGDVKNFYRTKKTFYPKCKIQNPDGNVRTLLSNNDETNQYYVLIFNENLVSDLQAPVATWNVLHTIRTAGG